MSFYASTPPSESQPSDTALKRSHSVERKSLPASTDAVVHLAALPSVPRSLQNPLASHHANATGTLQVLEAACRAGGPHVIAASSSSVYGANPHLPKHEELVSAPMSPYAVTKLTTEAYLGAYHHSFDLPVLLLRFFNVYGPGQRADHAYAAVIPKWISATLSDQPVTIDGDGTQTRDFTYVGTVAVPGTGLVPQPGQTRRADHFPGRPTRGRHLARFPL